MDTTTSSVYLLTSLGRLTVPTATPKAGRLPVEVTSSPMLLGKTVFSEGGMGDEVVYAVL